MEIRLDKTLPRLIKSKNISISYLAKKTKISPSTLYEWKNGRIPQNITHVKTVATALEVPLHYLLFETSDPFSQEVQIDTLALEGQYEVSIKRR